MVVERRRHTVKTKRRVARTRKKVRLAIECTPSERRKMKVFAASEDKTLNEFVLESVRLRLRSCSRSHIPNETTRKALEEVEKDEGLV